MKSTTAQGGLYQLYIKLVKPGTIQVGKLGKFYFPKGYYIYTGSAQNGLEGRIARHLRKKKKLYWHIDYLLKYSSEGRRLLWRVPLGKIEKIVRFPGRKAECKLHKDTLIKMKGENFTARFGASDCHCGGHLIVLPMSNLPAFGRNKDTV
jgi:Uri superfamily endonuclease